MEFFADLAMDGLSLDDMKRALLLHINHCPDCQEHHLQRLQELEDYWHRL
jgi:hypothetical protein